MNVLSQSIKLGLLFCILFTAYISFQNIITQVYQQQNLQHLGNYNLFVIYLAFMIGNFFAPRIATLVKYKTLLIIGTICYTINLFGGLITTYTSNHKLIYCIIMICGATSGFGSSILWVSQGGYMHLICQKYNIKNQKGYYFGIFYSLYSIANVTGGIATTFLLGLLDHRQYFFIIGGIGVFSTLYTIFILGDPQKTNKSQSEISINFQNRQSTQSQNTTQDTIMESVLKMIKFYPKMKQLLSAVGIVGLIIGFFSSSLHLLVQNSLPQSSSTKFISLRTGIAMIILGIGSIVGSFLSGFSSDRMKIRPVGSLAVSTYIFCSCLTLLAYQFKNYYFVVVAAFFIGFSQNFIQNWILITCSRTLRGALESFAINKQFHSFTFCVYQLILIFAKPSFNILLPFMILLSITLVISLVYIKQVDEIENKYILKQKQ